MSKRPAASPLVGESLAKKQKLVDGADVSVTAPATSTNVLIEIDKPNITEAVSAHLMDVDDATDLEQEDNTSILEDNHTAPAHVQENGLSPERVSKWKTNPPVKDAFTPWQPTMKLPASNQFWGVKPVPGDPRPHPDQPSARSSNGATNPPMWEDRKYRFKRDSQHVKYFGSVAPDDVDNLPESLDQEDLLVIQLIDMRRISSKNPMPRRKPTSYFYKGGKPKDWNNMQAIKCLNDRRAQAIERVTLDVPWTCIEREYLASLFEEFPDASIWELTERHNARFMGQDFAVSTGFSFADISKGRTVESVSHEYRTYKPVYDRGDVPDFIRFRNDNSREGMAIRTSKRLEKAFGPASKILEKEWDAQNASDVEEEKDGECATTKLPKKSSPKVKKVAPKKRVSKKKQDNVVESEDKPNGELKVSVADQPKLNEIEEELLEMAGAYDQHERECTPESISSYSSLLTDPPSFSMPSPRRCSPSSPMEEQVLSDHEVSEVVERLVSHIVDQAVAHAQSERAIKETDSQLQQSVENGQVILQDNIVDKKETQEPVVEGGNAVQALALSAEAKLSAAHLNVARKLHLDEDYDDEDEEV